MTSASPHPPPGSESEPLINDNPAIQSYYQSLESRIGYRFVLGGTRHFAYWDADTYFPFPLGPALRRMESKLLAALDLPRGSRVLDAGCGVGHVALYMAQQGGLRVQAIDIVAHHVEKARRNVQRAAGRHDGTLAPGQVTVQRMDYHHLESIGTESLEGVYTMETLVHATDPEAVVDGFLRILKPGGHAAFFEYDHDLDDKTVSSSSSSSLSAAATTTGNNKVKKSSWMAEDMKKVNEYAAMPTYQKSKPGYMKQLLEEAGFVDVVVRDYSENVKPMLRLFYVLAIGPYFVIKLLGLERYFANTIAGVLGYAAGAHCHYVAISARKPGELEVEKSR